MFLQSEIKDFAETYNFVIELLKQAKTTTATKTSNHNLE